MKRNERGVALITVLMTMLVLLITVPAIVDWLTTESKLTIKVQKSTRAFNLTDAAVDRGIWKLKSSTSSWTNAVNGTVITNYNFDKTYDDIAGGYYRIKITSGPSDNQATIYGEGRDVDAKETRAIKCIVENTVVNSALFSESQLDVKNHVAIVNWGPIMSNDNIDMTDNASAGRYFPRKYAKQVVDGHGGDPRDTNGLNPPNTDNVEWWSDYDVPDLPLIQFNEWRSSASANGTLNVYRYWDDKLGAYVTGDSASPYFEDSDAYAGSQDNLNWYWDGNVEFTDTIGIKGNVVIRGNMHISGTYVMSYTADVPSNAWKEYQKKDTSLADEYPADAGLNTNDLTFGFGTENWNSGAVYTSNPDVPAAADTKIDFKGFVYVGGNMTFSSQVNIHGALWVVGTTERTTGTGLIYIYYNNKLKDIPVSNVVLVRISWDETSPSSQAWAAP
ncbi:MAG: hypothetical protein HYT79_03955 [Elusimicrobia bacterium]|nr:hypothetical protein [Elusimicrobiota bacterium]